MSTGIKLILDERQRQINEEGFSIEHDDNHDEGALFTAGQCYLDFAEYPYDDFEMPDDWPWDEEWWKPSKDKVRNLVKAGALFQAERDRLERLINKVATMIDDETSSPQYVRTTEPPIPEFLVRVDYEIPPTRGILSMYFDDDDSQSDDHYGEALLQFHPTAIERGVTRKVVPVPGGSCS